VLSRRAAARFDRAGGGNVGRPAGVIALGYEDLNDHDELRHDPLMAVLAGKLEARREDCAPVAGKSTLNRLELGKLEPTRYHKISHNPVAIKHLFVDLFLEAHARPPRQIILDLDATDDPVHGEQEGRFFHGITTATAMCALRPRAYQCSPHQDRNGVGLSCRPNLGPPFGLRLPRSRAPRRPDTRRRTRHRRGITPGSPRSFPAQLKEKSQLNSRPPDATSAYVSKNLEPPSRNTPPLWRR
jgi:hypothetical protein